MFAWTIRSAAHIGVRAAEERLGAGDRQVPGDVHESAAAIVAPPRITLGVWSVITEPSAASTAAPAKALRRHQPSCRSWRLNLPRIAAWTCGISSPKLAFSKKSSCGIEAGAPARRQDTAPTSLPAATRSAQAMTCQSHPVGSRGEAARERILPSRAVLVPQAWRAGDEVIITELAHRCRRHRRYRRNRRHPRPPHRH